MKKLMLLPLIILLLNAHSQTSFWSSPQAYLGQTPPGSTPIKFAPRLINDSPFFSMDRCAFSADGKEFYYVRNNTWFSSKESTIREFKYDGTKWVGPTTIVKQYYAPTFSRDGNTIYLAGGGKGKILQIHRTATGWSEADTFLRRERGLYDLMPTNNGNMYVSSNVNGPANDYSFYDICLMPPVASGDTSVRTLGKPMNTPGFDGDFFVAPDESYILISAKEQPDFECEIFISYHKKDGTWTNPKSLGPQINNGPAHRWGEYVTADKKYLFYSYGHGPQDCALYWVKFDDLLEKLKHTNFEPYVKDSFAAQIATVNKQFTLHISDNTFFDDDGNNTLSYSATLADGSALPAWLTFNAKNKLLQGVPQSGGAYQVQVKATDNAKATAVCTFTLKVE